MIYWSIKTGIDAFFFYVLGKGDELRGKQIYIKKWLIKLLKEKRILRIVEKNIAPNCVCVCVCVCVLCVCEHMHNTKYNTT